MARLNNTFITQLFKGTVGKQITIYTRGDQTIIAQKRGPSEKPPTTKQIAARKKMKAAVKYAKLLLSDPEKAAELKKMAKKKGRNLNAFNLAVSEYFHTKRRGRMK